MVFETTNNVDPRDPNTQQPQNQEVNLEGQTDQADELDVEDDAEFDSDDDDAE
jgi:hypothetical protein